MRHSSFSLKQTSLALAMLLAAGCGAAQAQLDEIIVTAERRASNLQDVPVAVTALDADTIERLGITDPATLQLSVPNFTFQAFSPGQAIFSLRGVSSNDDGAGTDNSVAVFLDGVYFGRISNAAFGFFDVESVEVLRGPQGTLWGKNAIGGAISIKSKKPSLDGFEAKGKIDVGEYNTQNFGGYVTGPLNDNWAFKIATSTRRHDGYVTNLFDSSSTGENSPNNENSSSWRAQLLYEDGPTSALFTAAKQTARENDIGRMPILEQNPAVAGKVASYTNFIALGGSKENRISLNPNDGFANRDNETYSVEVNHELDSGIQLTSISAFYETSARWEMDSVGVGNRSANLIDDIRDSTEAYSQEFRIAADLSDDIDIVGGLFYLSEETDRSEYFRLIAGADDRGARSFARAAKAAEARVPAVVAAAGVAAVAEIPSKGAVTALTGDPDDSVGGYRQINETTSFAAFAHANWQFAPDWSLGLGLRYTEDEKDIVSTASATGFSPDATTIHVDTGAELTRTPDTRPGFIIEQNFGNIATGAGPGSKVDSGTWDDVTAKLSLNWNVNDSTLLYASYAEGFKSGGFGAAPASNTVDISLEPETAENFEIGIKADLLDDTLRINAAAFRTDYTDLQNQRFGPLFKAKTAAEQADVTNTDGCAAAPNPTIMIGGAVRDITCGGFGFFRTVNAGEAEITGYELEVTYAPTPNLTLTGNYGYLDTKAEFDFTRYFEVNADGEAPTGGLTLNRPLNRSPENKYSLGLLYESDMSAKGQLIYSLNYSYTDETQASITDSFATVNDYQLVDSSITYVPSEDAPWAFTLWAKNLTDETYFSHVYSVGPGIIGTLAPPRVLGASVSFEIN